MLRDVFYFGEKPNVHPREKFVNDLADAKRQSTTEHFWVINEHCNYKDFDWDWDFDFLPDEDVWAEEHNNVWPSPYQKDSGTWLCSTNLDALTIYRADVEPVVLKDEITNNWKIIEYIEKDKFDFKWHPDPTDPPYIYVFGNEWYPGTIMPTVEYHVPGAIDRKYVTDQIAHLLPMPMLFNIIYEPADFDYSWRPDPTAPPYIYVFGNTQYPASVMPTIEYHVEGATERKFIENIVPKLAARPADFETLEDIDPTSFDMTWVPDPTSPPYIYAWGNQWNKPEDKISVIRKVEGATEYKYMEARVKRLPSKDNWHVPGHVVDNDFDYSWEPNPNDPPYIYQFATQWQKTGGPQYVVEDATEVKYVDIKAKVVCYQFENWQVPRNIDQTKFDFSWHPDDTEQPYIYQFPDQWSRSGGPKFVVSGATEVKYVDVQTATAKQDKTHWTIPEGIDTNDFDFSWHPDIEDKPYIYHFGTQHQKTGGPKFYAVGVEEGDEIKYIDSIKAKALATTDNWVTHEEVIDFDYSWHPDATEQPYIYQWGNKHYGSDLQPTVEYIVPGATQIKHMSQDVKLTVSDKWIEHYDIEKTKFDMSWRPDPTSPPYIYVWGNKHVGAELSPTIEYVVPEATEYKFMVDTVELLPNYDKWTEVQAVDKSKFDFTWIPDPTSPPYIYVWGNKHIPAELKSTLEYHVEGATEIKYMDTLVEVLPEFDRWEEVQQVDRTKFDLTWRPDPREPDYIYVWGNKHIAGELKSTIEYHCPTATEKKYIEEPAEVLPEQERWKINYAVKNFDFTWRPDPREPAFIYVWGNKHVAGELGSTIEYHCPDATEKKFVHNDVELEVVMDNWKVLEDVADTFDFTWLPDPTSPPYIYVWGNKHVLGDIASTIEYHVQGATEKKYVNNDVEVLPEMYKWNVVQDVADAFDYSWRPNPTSPPYIYVWGNKYIPAELKSTIEYHVGGATEIKYMGDTDVVSETKRWIVTQDVADTFDMCWRPDPREPDYIYVWGNKHIPGELKATIEYHCPAGVERKYVGNIDVKPEWDRYQIMIPVDKTSFDFTWRPDPREPAFIYVWGNQHNRGEIEPTVIYTVPGATEEKFMDERITVLPDYKNWTETQPVNRNKFDFSWRPDPGSPPYIYVWGNKYISAELKPTVTYTVPGATEYKYFQELVEVLPETERWNVVQEPDNFDFAWRPDPREPDYIYVWGNKHIPGELKATIEYHCPAGVERKYVGNIDVKPEWDRYQIMIPVDKTSFDFTWRPDPREPAFIYVWGNQSNSAEKEPTIEYHCEGATERKYMNDRIAKTLPVVENWKILVPVDNFDFSWRPDPGSPPYIYVFGNQWHDATTEPTLEYHVEGATTRKFVTDIIATASKTQECWKTLIPVESFDYSWRPNPHSAPYIYVFGNQWHDSIKEPSVEYHTLGATDKKYIDDIVAISKSTATEHHWKRLIPIESFDYSWRPDPDSPPFIYVFGNKWNDATTEPSVEYHVEGATEYKYVDDPVATPQANLAFWSINNNDDLETFDFTWRPNPHSPPQIYQWADNGPRYTMPDATEVVFMERTVETRKTVVNRYKIKTTLEDLIQEHPEEVFWAINPDLSYEKFDFSWRPNEENFRHINVFGNEYSMNTQTYYVNAPLYMMGHREFNYVEGQTVEIDSNLSMFYIDRGNSESNDRLAILKARYPQIQKTRYLNSWVDTINRCINKSQTKLCWVLNSEIDYSEFEFDFYPSPWQEKMVHVFGTQWSHWGTTFMVNKESFPEDTKYVKIIEHLNVLNFVKSKRTIARNCLYPIYLVDHGNETVDEIKGMIVTKVKYEVSYLRTFKKLLVTLPEKNEHYIWVCSSICDYENFDFSYICDPYAKDQLHVFPSDKQKFGDTFLIDVNKFRKLVDDMIMLEDYEKVNYNQHQRVKRLPAPVIITESDTHVDNIHADFNWPYATFVTQDNKEINVLDPEPISLWTPDTKNILITSTGATRIIVPREAKDYVEHELYDYPYISRSKSLAQSQPLDIVFLSNGETGADENYEHLLKVTKGLRNRVVRVDGVNGRVAAYHAAAEASETPWMFTVFAKLKVNDKFDWTWQPDRLQVPKHYIFNATNPVNGLEYGHQAMIAYNKKITLANNGTGLDFTLDNEHEVVEMNSGIAMYNTDAWSTWRTSFREVLKLRDSDSQASKDRLEVWINKAEGDFFEYSILGAKDAIEYYDEVNGDLHKLRLSYDWAWLKERYKQQYD